MLFPVLLGGLAVAQTPAPDIPDFTIPPIDGDLLHRAIATQRTLVTEDAGRVETQARFTVQLANTYLNAPLLVSWDDGSGLREVAVLRDVVGVSVIPALAYDRFRLGLELPFYPVSSSDLRPGGFSVGSVALDGRLTALDPREAPIGLGLLARVDLASPDAGRSVGSDRVGYELGAAVERSFDALHLGLNVGYRGIPRVRLFNVIVDDLVFVRVAGAYDLTERVGLTVEGVGHTIPAMLAPDVAPLGDPSGAATPVEGLVGAWVKPHETLRVQTAFGGGLTPGLGSPGFRAMLDLTFAPNIEIGDRDDDGVRDRNDACPADAEDVDGFQDEDGCPDWDNDRDEIDDLQDACPDAPEDVDDFRDDDGCPDPTAAVRIRVVDASGQPVQGAILQVSGDGLEPTAEQRLDLHPGTYAITAFAPGHQANETGFRVRDDIEAGQEQDVQVVLPKIPPGKVQLLVRTVSGAALPDDLVVRIGDARARLVDGSVTVEVESGTVPIAIEPEGAYGAHWERVVVKSNELASVEVVLRRPAIRVSRTPAETQIRFRETVQLRDGVLPDTHHDALGELVVELGAQAGPAVIECGDAALGEAVKAWLVTQGVEDSRLTVDPNGSSLRIRLR